MSFAHIEQSPNDLLEKHDAHPLLYASLIPTQSAGDIPSIHLYKPKTKYSLGRDPHSDVVLDSRNFGNSSYLYILNMLNPCVLERTVILQPVVGWAR